MFLGKLCFCIGLVNCPRVEGKFEGYTPGLLGGWG